MIVSIGTDIIEVYRIRETIERTPRFVERVFTKREREYCDSKGAAAAQSYAGRFAAKEATMKALGTGVRGVGWKDIEVIRHKSGAPSIRLHGRAKSRGERLNVQEISLSLSHSREYAVAFVVTQCQSKT